MHISSDCEASYHLGGLFFSQNKNNTHLLWGFGKIKGTIKRVLSLCDIS